MTLIFGSLPKLENTRVALLFENSSLGRNGAASVSASSEAAEGNTPAANLLTDSKSDVWKSGSVAAAAGGSPAEITLDVSRGTATSVSLVGYDWSNVLVPWRVELYDADPSSGGELLSDTGWVNPVVKSEPDDFDYGSFPWSLSPSNARLKELASTLRLGSFWPLSPTVHGVKHGRYRFDVSDGANGDRDDLQAALLLLGRVWHPRINADRGVPMRPQSRSIVNKSPSGSVDGLTRRPGREVPIALSDVTDDETYELLRDWVDRQGEISRVWTYLQPQADLRRVYLEHRIIGHASSFEAFEIEEEEGEIDGVWVPNAVRGITISQTN